MTDEQIKVLCRSLSGVTEEILWGNDLVFKVAGKMFFCTGKEPGSCYSFKCSPDDFLELTQCPGIRPAPYLARAQWIQIDPHDCRLADEEIAGLIGNSYSLVVAKLPKKTQKALAKEDPT